MKTAAQYRKKPVVINAVQYVEYGKLVQGMCNSKSCYALGNTQPHVHTIHDNQIVILEVGDWIIPEPDGIHYYPCKPDIFEKTYEPILEGEGVEQVKKSDFKIAWELSQTREKPFFIDTFRKLLGKYDNEEISLSKFVEELNVTAYKWANESR